MKKTKTILKCLITFILLMILLNYLTKVFQKKDSYIKYQSFFEQKENFDVLFFGTSHVMNGIYPLELWDKYGIVSYNFGGAGNPIPTSYWIMRNALNYTKPKLVVIDCYSIIKDQKISSKIEFLHTAMDAFPLRKTKIQAINDLVEDKDMRYEFFWNFIIYHNRWDSLNLNDFKIVNNYSKGAEYKVGISVNSEHLEEIKKEVKLKETLSTNYLKKIIEYCNNEDIEVLLTYLPAYLNTTSFETSSMINIANEYGIEYINFMDLKIINPITDFKDDGRHLNISGATKVTNYIGKFIKDNYSISNQKNNKDYSFWYDDYNKEKENKKNILKTEIKFDNYLTLISDPNYSIIIEIYNPNIWESKYYLNIFENLGIKKNKLTNNTDFIIINSKDNIIEYYEKFLENKKIYSSIGTINFNRNLFEYSLLLNNKLYYSVITSSNLSKDIRICVLDSTTKEIIDLKTFKI